MILVRRAQSSEIEWINEKYSEIDFVKSDFENEFIVIAEIDGKKAGMGRIVIVDDDNLELGGICVFPEYRGRGIAEKIVSHLLEFNPYQSKMIWCLPFENLLSFYEKFEFKQADKEMKMPKEIAKKLDWCNSNQNYKNRVKLLFINKK